MAWPPAFAMPQIITVLMLELQLLYGRTHGTPGHTHGTYSLVSTTSEASNNSASRSFLQLSSAMCLSVYT